MYSCKGEVRLHIWNLRGLTWYLALQVPTMAKKGKKKALDPEAARDRERKREMETVALICLVQTWFCDISVSYSAVSIPLL